MQLYNGLVPKGPVQDFTELTHAHTNPAVPRVARENPVWDWNGVVIWAVTDRLYSTLASISLISNFIICKWTIYKKSIWMSTILNC